ncbi:glycoside hydrolase family 15 protein [Streptomyces hoynatensis]|uniref:Glycoside hydrolase family 15 n=1 Tax=Streptomyces hoynatensis TaxID=1141874 RepID=A0A3A9YUQ5_9ACTN|nr:glycoside hydrolase family 15 protein [Streptomyces hoynatensis]RKN39715.1 glycoside hydrolase family 15 [Streptomyces hoynatensis]
MPPWDHARLAAVGLAVLTGNQAPGGAYPACPAYPVYRYAWFRDGSFAAEAASRSGAPDSATAFHDWCARVITERADRIEAVAAARARGERPPPGALLPTRYTLEGREAEGGEWTDFQTDGYGTWLWALARHLDRHGLAPGPYRAAARLTVRYLEATWDLPCHGWWEEHPARRHVATLGALHGGLAAAARAGLADPARATRITGAIARLLAERGTYEGRLAGWLGGRAVDAALLACLTPFAVTDPAGPLAAATLAAVERDLVEPEGGVHRYLGDVFYGGGQWPVLAGFLGWHYARTGRTAAARRRLDWIAAQATPEGLLPEQAPGARLLHPEHLARWEAKWGPNATPLLWSHAMYLILAAELAELGELPERP